MTLTDQIKWIENEIERDNLFHEKMKEYTDPIGSEDLPFLEAILQTIQSYQALLSNKNLEK